MLLRPLLASLLVLGLTLPAAAAPCGDTSAGFEEWKAVMAKEAKAEGVGKAGIAALMAAACTQSGNAERSTSGGLVMGAAVGALAPAGR